MVFFGHWQAAKKKKHAVLGLDLFRAEGLPAATASCTRIEERDLELTVRWVDAVNASWAALDAIADALVG